MLGKENSTDFKNALAADGISYIGIEKEGRIRENLTIHTDSGETRISFSGFTLDNAVLIEISSLITADSDTVVTFTGSVPKGIDIPEVKLLLTRLKNRGARIVVDSRSFSLSDLLEVKPWLIKPNGEEIAEYSGRTVNSFEDCLEFARNAAKLGIENLMISLGEQGALLVTEGAAFVATPPRVKALSTVGAGDSTIAGFISAYSKGNTPDECLRIAVSYGTAACLLEGTTPPTPENIAEIYKDVEIKNL